MGRRNICVFHVSLMENYGGASSQCAWVMQALKDDYDVHFLSPDGFFDAARINMLYGTSFREGDVKAIGGKLPAWLRSLPGRWLKTLRLSYLLRILETIAPRFDMVIATVNELNLSFPSVQIINCPVRSDDLLLELYGPVVSRLRMLNNRLHLLISETSSGGFHPGTKFIANSEWTASAFDRAYGTRPVVMYPPVFCVPEGYRLNWEDREDGFVIIGRLASDKRTHEAVEIIDRLRSDFPNVHLHIVGSGEGRYARRIKELARKRPYVHMELGMSRDAINKMIGSHRYGLHMTRIEHFGMAPAEIASAGAVVFVHDSGGQVEIVDRIPQLIYSDFGNMLEKISKVMINEKLQNELRLRLMENSRKFCVERFVREVRNHVVAAMRMRGIY